ncbi:MAG: DEAD/DEAH box helicase family protein [Actinomycetota bacterium]
MKYSFKEHEKNYQAWCIQGYPITNTNTAPKIKSFIRNIENPNFVPQLYNHQMESIKRCIYSYEVLNKKDLLLEIVTGGGKSAIIAGMISYFAIVHDLLRFLILVPNTIVRARLVDEFNPDPSNSKFVYNIFPFFFNSYAYLKDRISLHVMEQKKDPVGIRDAQIILGNIHQIYDGKISLDIIQKNLGNIVIFNDEAHNSKAENYNDVLNKLKPQRIFRLDTTATPDRLDGLHPDSEKILEYGIRQAMQDRIIKRIIVCKPDIEKVKLTYKDIETGEELRVEEVPWEDIENKKIKPTRYITSEKPMRQQIAIAKQCLDYQKKTIAPDSTGSPSWKPLLFVVALSINDAKNIKRALENVFKLKTLLVTNESEDAEKDEAMKINKHLKDCEYDAIVSVLMLREGWDVKNISVILLFRKFCYKLNENTGEKYSVYGQQVIGRGLRRINPQNKEEWEQCFVVDHPVLQHDWLWEILDADQYQGSLNPDDIIDIKKIPEAKPYEETPLSALIGEDAKDLKFNLQEIINNIPDPTGEEIKILHEWQEFLDSYQYKTEQIDIEQTITDIKKRKLAAGFNEQEIFEDLKIDVNLVNEIQDMSSEQLEQSITQEVINICRDALLEYDRNPDKRQDLIYKVLIDHIKKRFLLGNDLGLVQDKSMLKKLWFAMMEMREMFLDPGLISGILANPPSDS